jgi:hypothetical protein
MSGADGRRPLAWVESLAGIVLAVLIIVVGFFLDNLKSQPFLMALGLVLTSSLAGALVTLLIVRVILNVRLDTYGELLRVWQSRTDATIGASLDDSATKFNTLSLDLRKLALDIDRRLELLRGDLQLQTPGPLADPYLADYERTGGWLHIYIVTDELLVQLGGKKDPLFDWIEIMRENLARGVRYTYVVPNRVHIHTRQSAIANIFGDHLRDGNLRFLILTEDQWSQLPVSLGEYLIYDGHDDSSAEVFYALPTARGRQLRQWIRVGSDYCDHWIGQTFSILNGVQPMPMRKRITPNEE